MDDLSFTFSAKTWQYNGKGGWVFVTMPNEQSEQIKFFSLSAKRGFGSVRVSVTIKDVEWHTSLFPDAQSGRYLLPLKVSIRKKLNIEIDDNIDVEVSILT